MAQVVLVPGGCQSLVGDAHLEGPVLPQQVVGNAPEDDYVVGGVARTDTVVVLAKSHVPNPVVGVFDGPMPAHRLQLPIGLGRQGGWPVPGHSPDSGTPVVGAAHAFAVDGHDRARVGTVSNSLILVSVRH